MKRLKSLAATIAVALIAGCAPVISEGVLETVDRSIEFRAVASDPSAHAGKRVVFGGTIILVENLEGATVMEVVQEGLNSQLKPVAKDESAGRFLVRFGEFKDPAVFGVGKRITVAGVVKGSETRPLGKGTYRYSVIEPNEYYLWERSDYDRGSPRIGIGLGLGFGF